ncbi:MAG: hypothetical protein U1E65_27900 [Myxococcota bacterium]
MRFVWAAGLLLGVGCSEAVVGTDGSARPDGSAADGADRDAGLDPDAMPDAGFGPDASDDGGARRSLGFVFDGQGDVGVRRTDDSYALLPATGAATRSATIGTSCTVGDDCAALGSGAGCLRAAQEGFCTRSCPAESDHCGAGLVCARNLVDVGICLPTCTGTTTGCSGVLDHCSGPFFTFEIDVFPSLHSLACFPGCSTDDDCQPRQGERVCSRSLGRCADPEAFVGRSCHGVGDCGDLGPTGRCLTSPRDPNAGYCTTLCEVQDPLGSGCVGDYAQSSAGDPVGVRLKTCAKNEDCQLAGDATCNFFPETNEALCSVRCRSDLDCPSGACNPQSGNCQQHRFWATECGADINCATGLCVSDFHAPEHRNCTRRCFADGQCQAGEVCVTSPSAHLEAGGFCAPSCTPGGAACPDPSARCILPVAVPEIDFAGSGSASGPFCWR